MAGAGSCKVDIITERYELSPPGNGFDSMDAWMIAKWKGEDGGSSIGYKQLTVEFNRRLLKTVYERHGRETVGNRVESDYEALTSDDALVREEIIDDLVADGIDGEALGQDFVSWSTVRRHLKNCLEASKPTAESETHWERNSVDIAKNQLAEKMTTALRSLGKKGRLPAAEDAEIDVQVKVGCPECPTRVPFGVALERGYVCSDHMTEAGAEPDKRAIEETTK